MWRLMVATVHLLDAYPASVITARIAVALVGHWPSTHLFPGK